MTTLKRWQGTDWEYVGLPTNVGMAPQTLGFAINNDGVFAIPAGLYKFPGLSVTVTVPEGRRLKISTFLCLSGGNPTETRIYRNGTQLNRYHTQIPGGIETHDWSVIDTPPAGTHTYDVYTVNGASGTAYADGTNEFYLLVEDITGSTLPYQPASVPVGVLGQSIRTTDILSIGTSEVDSGLAVNITVPAGRTLRVNLSFSTLYTASTALITTVRLKQDGVAIFREDAGVQSGQHVSGHVVSTVISPSAGAHTYTAGFSTSTGTINLGAGAAWPAILWVEDITATPAPANTAPSSTLAYAEVSTNQTSITTITDLTGLTATVTVPAGRRIKITGHTGGWANSAANAQISLEIWEGAVQLQAVDALLGVAGNGMAWGPVTWIGSPSAGTHTYKLRASQTIGSGGVTMNATTVKPAFILIEDITGVGVSGHTHTELDDTGWISLLPYLVNGWVSYDNTYGPPRFRKKAGVVYVQGLVKNGTVGNVIATLPVGFRPDPTLPKLLFAVNAHTGDTAARVDVDSNGQIIHIGSWNDYYSLTGIIFPT